MSFYNDQTITKRLAKKHTGCSLNIVFFFLNSASSAAALVFYLPGICVCTHTDTEGKQRKARVGNISKSSEKNTIFNEHPLVLKKGWHPNIEWISWDVHHLKTPFHWCVPIDSAAAFPGTSQKVWQGNYWVEPEICQDLVLCRWLECASFSILK